jgi:hypothetical protein
MSPFTHLLASWLVAQPLPTRRGRLLVTLAGLAPDADGLGILAQVATRGSDHPVFWFTEYHHRLAHNVLAAAVVTALCWWWSQRDWRAAALGCLAFHLHLVCDLLGSRGLGNYQWPVPYLAPFSQAWQLTWTGQWPLFSWPNVTITLTLFALTLVLAWRRGFSPLELVSARADRALVETLRRRWPVPSRGLATQDQSPPCA